MATADLALVDERRGIVVEATADLAFIDKRFLFANDPQALTAVLVVVQRALSTFVILRSGLTVSSGARTGAVTLIQRFGSALNLNVHLHMLFLDRAYTFRRRGRR